MAEGIIHIAGPDLQVGDQLRQRCAWCGAVLLEYDLPNTAVPEGQDLGIGTWPPGALIEVDGNASRIVDHADGDPLPPNACGQIDHEITGTAAGGSRRGRIATGKPGTTVVWPPPGGFLGAFCAWLAAHGIDPDVTTRVEHHDHPIAAEPFIRVFQRHLLTGAEREPFNVPITTPPPIPEDYA